MDRVEVAGAAELEAWLAAHHGRDTGIWLVTWKKHAGARYVGREAVLDALIAWGWIDGRRKVLDADRTMQFIAPRRTTDWALSYRARAARLSAEGRMQPPGLAALEAGRKAGGWTALADVDALEVPDDLAEALRAAPPADRNFTAFAPSKRRNILRWIAKAKRAETRARRIALTADLARRNETPPQM